MALKLSKSVRDTPPLALNHNVYAKVLPQTHTGSMIFTSFSVSSYESCVVNFIGCVLTVSLSPLVPNILLSPHSLYILFINTFSEFLLMFGCGSLCCSHQLLNEESLMLIEVDTNL